MIDRQSQLPIGRQTKLLGISRGSVYYLPKPVSERDLGIMKRLDQLHLKHPFMGDKTPVGYLESFINPSHPIYQNERYQWSIRSHLAPSVR